MNKKSVVANFIWKFSEKGLSQLLHMIISFVLARLLDPSAYGIVALSTVVINVLQVFVDSGLGISLIQKKDADDLDFSSVFYFNVFGCTILYVGLFFFAPLISSIYNEPQLISIVRVSGLSLIVSGVRSIQYAYVSRNMQFKKNFIVTLPSVILSGALGIFMAYNGFGVWALVAMNLANITLGTILLWVVIKWRPLLKFSFKKLIPLIQYGWKVLVSGLLSVCYNSIRQLLVGKVYSTSDLAYYNKGSDVPHRLVPVIQNSIVSVFLPTVAKQQTNLAKVKEITSKSVSCVSAIIWPMLIGLAVCSEPFIRLVLTEKWLPAVPYMQLFCIEQAFWPIAALYTNNLLAIGHSGMVLKVQTAVRVIGLLLLFILVPISPFAIALGAFVCTVLEFAAFAIINCKLLNLTVLDLVKDVFSFFLLAAIMGAAVLALGMLQINTFLLLVLQIIVGIAVYSIELLLFRRDMVTLVMALIRKKPQQSE